MNRTYIAVTLAVVGGSAPDELRFALRLDHLYPDRALNPEEIGRDALSFVMAMDGHTDVEFFPVISPQYRSPAKADFTFPLTAVFGVSYRPTPKWNLEFDADYVDIFEIRGRCNRMPSAGERAIVERWAAVEGLKVGDVS